MSFQFSQSVGSCLWCTGDSQPAEGAARCFYRPAVQRHWQRLFLFQTSTRLQNVHLAAHWSAHLKRSNPSLPLTPTPSTAPGTQTHILPHRQPSICVKYYCFVQKCEINPSDEGVVEIMLFSVTETGDFLNCEGSGLFLLQSSCENCLYSYWHMCSL